MKRKIDLWEHAGKFLAPMGEGLLLTAKAEGKVNPMTIGRGTLGIQWGVPVFIAFVRTGRFTHSLLEKNPEFTVSAPWAAGAVKKILGFCGTRSGREVDKVAACGLTLEEPEVISVPAIRELPLTLECRVIYRQQQDLGAIAPENLEKFYPQEVDSSFHGRNRDLHTAFYGQVLASYLVEQD